MPFILDESTTGLGYFRTFSALLKIIIIILCIIPTIILSANFNEDILKVEYSLDNPNQLFVMKNFTCEMESFPKDKELMEKNESIERATCIRNSS